MTLDLRDVPASRNIRTTDVAFGWEHSLTSETAARRSSWQEALELAGLYVQFSENNSTWSDTATVDDTHFRIASGTEKPADTSARWSAGIALGLLLVGQMAQMAPMAWMERTALTETMAQTVLLARQEPRAQTAQLALPVQQGRWARTETMAQMEPQASPGRWARTETMAQTALTEQPE